MTNPRNAPTPSAPKPPASSQPAELETEDDDLILWMLSLTPKERLEAGQYFADTVWELRKNDLSRTHLDPTSLMDEPATREEWSAIRAGLRAGRGPRPFA
jgi:hypothetical protein